MEEEPEVINRVEQDNIRFKGAMTSIAGFVLLVASEHVPKNYPPPAGMEKLFVAGGVILAARGLVSQIGAIRRIEILNRRQYNQEDDPDEDYTEENT